LSTHDWKFSQRSFEGKERVIRRDSFEAFDTAGREQGPHLGDGDVVEGGESFGLRQALADEDGGHGVKAEILKSETLKWRGRGLKK
jgi:hypothetical protein